MKRPAIPGLLVLCLGLSACSSSSKGGMPSGAGGEAKGAIGGTGGGTSETTSQIPAIVGCNDISFQGCLFKPTACAEGAGSADVLEIQPATGCSGSFHVTCRNGCLASAVPSSADAGGIFFSPAAGGTTTTGGMTSTGGSVPASGGNGSGDAGRADSARLSQTLAPGLGRPCQTYADCPTGAGCYPLTKVCATRCSSNADCGPNGPGYGLCEYTSMSSFCVGVGCPKPVFCSVRCYADLSCPAGTACDQTNGTCISTGSAGSADAAAGGAASVDGPGSGGTISMSTGGTRAAGGAGGSNSTASETPPPVNGLGVYLQQRVVGSAGQITLNLRIDNKTPQSVDMSTVTLRYWYQDEGLGTNLVLTADYVSLGMSNQGKVTSGVAVVSPSPIAGADHYLELAFTGTLAAQGDKATNDQFNLLVTLHTPDYTGTVDVTNDYSYDGGASLLYEQRITLYNSGNLIWGIEPTHASSSGTSTGTATVTVTGGVSGSTQDAGEDDAASVNKACLINGIPEPPGTVCRVAAGPCDLVEVCDGVSTACPLDRFQAATVVCRPTAGACDLAEKCTGASAACPTDRFLAEGAVCRAAVSVCDVAEFCDGASAACPVDVLAPAATLCRASSDGNICDPPESCTGTSNACPADAKYTPPAAPPTGVAVAPGTLQADVSWSMITGDAGIGVTGYNVKSSIVSGAGYAVRGSPADSPFTVTPITANQTYYFAVSAYSGQPLCESANSPEVSAMSCLATAPAVLTATPDSTGSVVLSWAVASGAATYNVSRSTTKGGPYTVVTSGVSATSYKDSPPVPSSGSATFYYVVRANTGNCNSPYSPEAAAVAGNAAATP